MISISLQDIVQNEFNSFIKINLNECRVPAGDPAGGQFTSCDSIGGSGNEPEKAKAKEKKQTPKEKKKNYSKIIDTPEFKAWFGKSKVVEKDGTPKMVFHGSPSVGYAEFKTDPSRPLAKNETSTLGAWFTDNPKTASTFTKDEFGRAKNAGTYPVYLSMQNPKVYEPKPDSQAFDFRKNEPMTAETYEHIPDPTDPQAYSIKKGTRPIMWSNDPFEQMMDDRDEFAVYVGNEKPKDVRGFWRSHYANMNTSEANKAFVDKLKAEGYDGIVIKSTDYDSPRKGTKVDQYVVFEPSQVKSVFNKKPTSDKVISNASINEVVQNIFGRLVSDGTTRVTFRFNECREPAGSPEGGQFASCDTGVEGSSGEAATKYEKVKHPKYSEKVPTYKTPYKNVKMLLSSVEPNVADPIIKKVSDMLSTNGIELEEFRLFNTGSDLALYNGNGKAMTLNAIALDKNWEKSQVEIGLEYKKAHGAHYTTNDILAQEDGISYVESAIAHEEGHAIMWKNALMSGKTTTKLNEITKKCTELRPPKYSGFMVPPDIKEKQAAYKKMKTAQKREANTFYTTREWSSLIKSEMKAGWKPPTVYSKSEVAETFAECHVLHKYGKDNYLSPKIVEYIDRVENKVRGK